MSAGPETSSSTVTGFRPEYFDISTQRWKSIDVGEASGGLPLPWLFRGVLDQARCFGRHQALALAYAYAAVLDGDHRSLYGAPEVRIVAYEIHCDLSVARKEEESK